MKTSVPEEVKLPKPVETHEHEDKRHRVADYVYKAPKKEGDDDGEAR